MEDLLSCPICLELLGEYGNPVVTSCGHTFCEGCLPKGFSFDCPTCRKYVFRSEIIRNYRLISLVDHVLSDEQKAEREAKKKEEAKREAKKKEEAKRVRNLEEIQKKEGVEEKAEDEEEDDIEMEKIVYTKPYRNSKPLDERLVESNMIMSKYPDRRTIILETEYNCDLWGIKYPKRKWLLLKEMSVDQYIKIIRKGYNIQKIDGNEQDLYLYINNKAINDSELTIEDLYNQHVDRDGYLYMTYSDKLIERNIIGKVIDTLKFW